MNDLTKTLTFVVVAVCLTGLAAVATRPSSGTDATFAEQDQEFFPGFEDPRKATAMEVVDFDEPTAEARAFKVMLKGKDKEARWVIPSHNNYPADAKDRLAKTAAGVIGLEKDRVVSDSAADHEALGVVDPLDAKARTLKGRGKRVTMLDQSGGKLAEFIIGKAVEGRTNQRYVRVPGQKRTYAATMTLDLSTRFPDWIETNLLKLDPGDIRKIIFDNHKVDPEAGRIQQGEVLTIERKTSSAPWTMEGLAPDQELDTEKLNSLTTALGDLKIVGVRPKPAGLTQALKGAAEKGLSLTREAVLSLQQRGFYVVQGRLLSNQGDVIVTTEDGIVYTLRFGEVTFATGDALSSGAEEEKAREKSAGKDDAKKDAGAVESRYLFVTADFDPSLIPAPTPPPAEGSTELPLDVFAKAPEEAAAKAKADKEKADREKADYDRKLADGKKTAQELTDRFADWYYVVPGDAFRNVVLDREALTRKKGEKPEPPAMPPGGAFPGGAFPGGLPPGHP